jgi:hypothetical protein
LSLFLSALFSQAAVFFLSIINSVFSNKN